MTGDIYIGGLKIQSHRKKTALRLKKRKNSEKFEIKFLWGKCP